MILKNVILAAVQMEDAIPGTVDKHGERYSVEFDMKHAGRTARVRSVWIIDAGSAVPRLITCFVL